MTRKMRYLINRSSIYIILIFLSILTIFPIYWMIGNSFKTGGDFFFNDLSPPLKPTLDWYFKVTDPRIQGLNIGQAYFNTIVYFLITAPLVALFGAMNGFAFAKYSFRGKMFVIAYLLIGMAIPAQIPMITLFVYFSRIGLINTVPGLILIYVAGSMPFNTFLLYSYFRTVPKDLFESAYIDGATDLNMFFYIALPICRPMFYVSFILHGIWVWNEYVLSYTFVTDNARRTMTAVAATTLGGGIFGTWMYPLALAGLTLVLVPIMVFYLVMNRKIIQGFIQGALGKF